MATLVTANGSQGGPDGKTIGELRKSGNIPEGYVASIRGTEMEDDYTVQSDDVIVLYPKSEGGI